MRTRDFRDTSAWHTWHVTCEDDMSPSPTCDTMTSFPPAPLLPRPEMGLSGMPGVSGYPPHPPPFHPGSFSPGHFPGLGPTNSFSTPSGGWRPTNSHKAECSQSPHFRIPRDVSPFARLPLWARARVSASAPWGGQRQGRPQGDAGAQGALDRVPQERDRDGDHQVRPVSVVTWLVSQTSVVMWLRWDAIWVLYSFGSWKDRNKPIKKETSHQVFIQGFLSKLISNASSGW